MNEKNIKRFEKCKKMLEDINLNEGKDYKILSLPENFNHMEDKLIFSVSYNNELLKFEMSAHNFFNNGYRLPKGLTQRKSQTDFEREIFNLVGDEYKLVSKYNGSQTKVIMYHSKCKRQYSVLANEFLNGKRCSFCSNRMKLTTDIFKERVYNLVKDEYIVQTEYINSNTPIQIYHTVCKHSFPVIPHEFTSGVMRRCPYCNGLRSGKSIGSTHIYTFLENNKIINQPEFIININNHIRRFDYKINDNLFIEFDGAQHFREDHFNIKRETSEERLKRNQDSDDEKNDWIIKNNKVLLRIPYKCNKEKIYKILSEFIKLNDQSKDVGIETLNSIKDTISETGGLLIFNYSKVRYDLDIYRKINS